MSLNTSLICIIALTATLCTLSAASPRTLQATGSQNLAIDSAVNHFLIKICQEAYSLGCDFAAWKV